MCRQRHERFAYPLDSYRKSYRLVADHTLCITINMPHGHEQGWAPVEIGLFVDQYLKAGKPLPRIKAVVRRENQVEVEFHSDLPIQSRRPALHQRHRPLATRKWHSETAKVDGTTIKAKLPKDRPLVYFLSLTDRRKATVSTEHQTLEK